KELSVGSSQILYERGDDDAERLDKRQKSGDRHQPTTQQSSHRNHGPNNDRHGSDRRGGGDNHRSNNNYSGNNNRNSDTNDRHGSDRRGGSDNHCSNNNYSGSNNRNFGYGRDQRNMSHQSNRSANSVCTTCGRRHPGECRRAAGTCFNCGQAGHLQKDCKKNTTTSTSGQADKKPG
nr:zinc finger, CCHC-type, retrotransposon Gag domain protein [Tanacetum cinerariifolium]